MPRLVKGAKWTFGWVVVGPGGEIAIPLEAWREYGFRAGGEAIFTPGSGKSCMMICSASLYLPSFTMLT